MMNPNRFSVPALCSFLFPVVILVSCVMFSSCTKSKETQVDEARHAITALMQTKKEAAQELSISKYLSPYDHSPDFAAFINGTHFDYDGFAEVCTGGIQPLRRYELLWDTLYTRVVSPDVVAAYAPFREILVDTTGAEEHMKGRGTWIAHRIDSDWKFVYADIYVRSVPASQ